MVYVKGLFGIVLLDSERDENWPLSGDYRAYEVGGGRSVVSIAPAEGVADGLRCPPDDIDVIVAEDETGDPVHYHVTFSDRSPVPASEFDALSWSIDETDYPHPGDIPARL